jgi:EpsD family peptidyl-prolyl cis-trans isomerase
MTDSTVGGSKMKLLSRAAGAASLASVLVACGTGGGSHKTSQVVATVNDKEITVSQLDLALQSASVETLTQDVAKQAVDSLVDEELLVQQAVKDKLDREPAVMQALEHARRKVLAQSFAERRVFARAQPTDVEVGDYYRKNPLLFENRKLYRFMAFSTDKTDLTPAVRKDLDETHSVEMVRAALEKHAIRYTTQVATIAPEQVLSDRLPDFAEANVGDLLMWDKPEGKQLLMSLTAVEDSPVSLAQASPMIRQYLINASRKEALDDYLKRTRATARIAYLKDMGAPAEVAPAVDAGAENAPTEREKVIKDGIAGLN